MTEKCRPSTYAQVLLLLTGFSIENALSQGTATFVTSLYDIGRGSWSRFPRSFSSYLQRFQHLLALDINLVIFGEESLKSFVRQHRHRRRQFTSKIKFLSRPFCGLPAYRHRLRIECVLESKTYRENNLKLNHPEAFSADYLVIVHSKLALVSEVMRKNPFNTTHFFWIDAGYAAVGDDTGCCQVNVPAGTKWRPEPLLSFSDKVTYIQLHDPHLYRGVELHKQLTEPALAGGFFGGAQNIMTYYERLYNKCFLNQLTEGEIGEDQGVALHVFFQHPQLFYLVRGGWFDAYRWFH